MHTTPRLRAWAEVGGILLLQGLFRPLPPRWASRLGSGLGWFLFAVLRVQRQTTLDSLEIAFGDGLSPAERLRLAGRCYRHFGAAIAEFIVQGRLAGRDLGEYLGVDNPALLDEALARGKGLLLVAGHLGNWELLMAAVAARKQPFASYVGRQHNRIADGMVNALRQRMGIATIDKQSGMRGIVRALKAGGVVAFATDQHFSRNRHFVRFFGRPVSIAPGMAALMQHTGVPALFTETWRVGRFRYRTRLVELPAPPPSGDEELDLLRISQGFFDVLEVAARRHPEQYFWMHRRWRPPPRPEDLSPTNRAFLSGNASPAPHGAVPPPHGAVPPPHGAVPPPHGAVPPPHGAVPPPHGAVPPPRSVLREPLPPGRRSRAPIFLDRDGTLIEEVGYLSRLEQMRLLPGAAAAVRAANGAGHPVIVVSNQSGVARGRFSEAFARESGEHLRRLLAAAEARLDGYYYCPYHPQGRPPYDQEHPDRKPGVGMLVRAAQELNLLTLGAETGAPGSPELALQGAWMIGDKRSDLETGAAQGVIPVLVRTGYGRDSERDLPPDFAARGGRIFDDLAAAIAWIVALD